MSRFHLAPSDDRAEINLSPMLDVVFILLIFFIVIASFVREDGLPIDLPNLHPLPPHEVQTIQVAIDAAGRFIVNGTAVARDGVRDYVRALHGEYPSADFLVVVGAGSRVRDMAVAADAGRSVGFDVITLVEPDSPRPR